MPTCEVWCPGHLGVFPLISLKILGHPKFFWKPPNFLKNHNIFLKTPKRTLFFGKPIHYSRRGCTKIRYMKRACTCKLILLASTHVPCTCMSLAYMYNGTNKRQKVWTYTAWWVGADLPCMACCACVKLRCQKLVRHACIHILYIPCKCTKCIKNPGTFSPFPLLPGQNPKSRNCPGETGTVGMYVTPQFVPWLLFILVVKFYRCIRIRQ